MAASVIGNVVVSLLFLAAWIGIPAYLLHFHFKAVPETLARWAESEGYRTLRKERRHYFTGPFFWDSSNFQVVYRVNVMDVRGQERWGWVRIGQCWWPNTDQIHVEWDPPRPAPIPEDMQPTRGNPLMWDRELDI